MNQPQRIPSYHNDAGMEYPQSMESNGMGLGQIIDTIWRRKKVIFVICLFFLTVATAVLFLVRHRYTAEALIMIGGRDIRVANMELVVNNSATDMALVEGQLEVLKSTVLARKVIKDLALEKDPEFNPRILLGNKAKGNSFLAVMEEYNDRLLVSQKGKSRVVSVRFTSFDAHKAAKIANYIADMYLLDQKQSKSKTAREVTKWLGERIEYMRKQVQESELAVERFKQSISYYKDRDTSLDALHLSDINKQLILAQAGRAELQTRLGQLKNILNRPGGTRSAADLLQSELIGKLVAQRTEVERQIAEYSGEYGKKHPVMLKLNAKIRSYNLKVSQEVNRLILDLKNRIELAKSRENSLRLSMGKIKNKVAVSNKNMIKLRALEREAEAHRSLLKSFLLRVKETSIQQDMQQADARIINPALVPEKPSFPKPVPIMMLVTVASGFIGLVIIFAGEHIFQGFRSADQIEQDTGVQCLGFIPLVHRQHARRIEYNPERYLKKYKHSIFLESFNSLRWRIHLNHDKIRPRRIMITSTLPREGKSTVSLYLAAVQAGDNQKVILIDADCRMSKINRMTRLPLGPGLSDVLSGKCTLEEAVHPWGDTGVHIIPAGHASSTNPSNAVASDDMNALLSELQNRYDVVICDTPPITAALDAMILAKRMDAVIFVVRWSYTRRTLVERAVKQFAKQGSNLTGVLLSMVDVRKHSEYGYSDSGYYGRGLEGYYSR